MRGLVCLFFILYLIAVVFFNTPVSENYGEEITLLVSIITQGIAYSFYRQNRDEFSTRLRRDHKKNNMT